MRKLASIREVSDKRAIPGADNIEMVVVDGWECVVLKSENINIGDKVVYIEIDSIVPDCETFEFMRERKFRVKTIKLRGQISQGLVQPMCILKKPANKYKLGDDVTEELGIKKYDLQAVKEHKMKQCSRRPRNKFLKWLMRYEWFRELWRKTHIDAIEMPGWIIKTDEEHVQNIPRDYAQWAEEKIKFIVTEKLDGCSYTAFIKDNEFGICSRNLLLLKNNSNNHHYFDVTKTYNIKAVLEHLKEELNASRIVLQGEIIGPDIQNNKYDLHKYYLYVFNLIVDNKKLSYNETYQIIKNHKLMMVPLLEDNYILPNSIRDIVEHSKGNSVLLKRKREGIVVRNSQNDISFKVINPDFLLEIKE